MKKIFKGIFDYLKDWKNWIVHGLVGVVLLVLVIWTPISWYYKLIILACIVCFNIFRMRLSKKKALLKTNFHKSITNEFNSEPNEIDSSDEKNITKMD